MSFTATPKGGETMKHELIRYFFVLLIVLASDGPINITITF